MKIVGFVGSPRKGGNTETLVEKALEGAASKGAETALFNIARMDIKGCQACMHCRTNDGCALQDEMQAMYREIQNADAVIIGFPVYMFTANAQTKTFIDRLYPYLNLDFTSKVHKNTALVITQGQPDKEAFKPNFEWTKNSLGFLGFPVKEILIEGGNRDKKDAASNHDALERAMALGMNLVAPAKDWAQ